MSLALTAERKRQAKKGHRRIHREGQWQAVRETEKDEETKRRRKGNI